MYTLFKLDSKEEGFANISEAKDFFSNELSERDKNYFYNENRILHIKHDETICFSLSDYIVAKATFVGEIIENNNREGKNKFGHKLVNIEIIDSSEKSDVQIINGIEKFDEEDRVLNSNLDVYPDEVDEFCGEETKTQVFVNKFERNNRDREACLKHFGYNCQVCDFDFELIYGNFGKDSIHVHHVIPLSEIGASYEVDPIKDLIPVCPNCHLILHRYNAPTINELKAILLKR